MKHSHFVIYKNIGLSSNTKNNIFSIFFLNKIEHFIDLFKYKNK